MLRKLLLALACSLTPLSAWAAGTCNLTTNGLTVQTNSPSTTNTFSTAVDSNGNCITVFAQGLSTTTLSAWTSATSGASTQSLLSGFGPPAVAVQLDQTTTITGGVVTFQATYDGTNWVSVPAANVINPTTGALIGNPYTLVASTNQPFLILTGGAQGLRINLSTVISGTGSVTPYVATVWTSPYTNLTQVNGTTLLTGAGAVGAGSQRVAVGQDTTTIAGSAPGTAGTPSTNVITVQGPTSGGTPQPVTGPAAAARHFPGCTVGTASAQCLAASTAVSFVQIQNTSASASIACAWGATAVLNSSTSFLLASGQSASWGLLTGGVPTGALNCIASVASTPAYVEWN